MKLLRREIVADAGEGTETEVAGRYAAPPEPADGSLAPALKPTVLRRFEALSPSDALAPGYTDLLDRLRARAAQGMPARTLIFASPSPSPATAAVIEGLASRAEQLGLQVVRGELRGAAPRSQPSTRRSASIERPSRQGLMVAPRPTALDPEVRVWLSQYRDADLVLIEGPPLLHSIDAALVARACDGLVLVAEQGATERRALQEAASRARLTACSLLGVVVTGAEDPRPRWLRRLLGGPPRSLGS